MFYELASLSIRNLLRARSRLFMTAGGVMIGTTAVTLLIALTIGLQTAAEASIGDSTSLTEITISSSFRRDSSSPTLDMDAVEELASMDDVAAVIPMLQLSGFVELRAGDLRGAGQIYGVYPATLPYLGVTAAEGTLELDNNYPYAAVIGGTVEDNFVDEDADTYSSVTVNLMDESIEMRIYGQGNSSSRKVSFTINAILEDGSSWDSAILFPMQTVIDLTERITGSELDTDDLTFSRIVVQASSRETAASVLEAITNLGYNASGTGSYLSELNSFFGTLRIVLGGVGGVAMLVAAFGVANTMTMAILERTHEIGLMKAVGATDRAVMTIFLIEAGMVGLLGGAAGLAVSYLFQNLGNQVLADLAASGALEGFLSVDLESSSSSTLLTIPSELAFFAVALATCIGIAAGLYPAMRASRMTPVLALKSD
ncbi:MAG: ABC transporter permease [Anaerolineae bacterium]|nr:ABC transporter permease [Anaerolineae bacterium]MCA9893873.1 ABC transporter permease [Anaerolineae bacterium]